MRSWPGGKDGEGCRDTGNWGGGGWMSTGGGRYGDISNEAVQRADYDEAGISTRPCNELITMKQRHPQIRGEDTYDDEARISRTIIRGPTNEHLGISRPGDYMWFGELELSYWVPFAFLYIMNYGIVGHILTA